jgi:hypothetical protein
MKGLKDMKSSFRREKLPVPAVPAQLQESVAKLRDWAWGTRQETYPLYDIDAYVDEATQGSVDDYFMLGQDGHGTNSWFLHCYISLGPASIFVQSPWGGAYSDAKAALDGIQRRFAVLERLLRAVVWAQDAGVLLPGRLIIQQSSTTSPRWAWVAPGLPVAWHEEFANAMTPALESLQQLHTQHSRP